GQVEGGIVHAIGMALTEGTQYEDGRQLNPHLLDYKLQTAVDAPAIAIEFVETRAAGGPRGAKGVGEPPIVPTAGAIANAIHRVPGLDSIEEDGDGLRLGALVTHARIEGSPEIRARYRALADAAALVGSPATRHAGTIGGNVVNASPAIETGSPLLVFAAEIELQRVGGRRTLPYLDFVRGPGLTDRRPDELLTAVRLPALP